MKLPHYEAAVVVEAKIVHYLLNESHTKGKSKAKFFRAFGFVPEQWEVCARALIRHAADHDVATEIDTELAIQYTIEGTLITPDTRNPFIRSVWAIDHGDEFPHFVTAYPVDED